MKKHFKILFFVAPVILVAAALLIKVSSAATPSSAQLPLSCYDSVTQSSRAVDPDRGCAISDDVIVCPPAAPNVWFGTKDYVQGNLVIKDNIQTMFCIRDDAQELIDPVKCKKPNGSIYYSDSLCGAYNGLNNTTIYPEAIQCRKDYILQNGGCSKISSSPSPSPSPSASPAAMMACGMNGGYWRRSDNTCQPSSNCWDTAHADYNSQECQGIRRTMPAPPPPPPPPPPGPGDQCPRKPDTAKGTAEPGAIPEGYQHKEVPSYYLWGCYSQPDKTNASCTAQAIKRTGNATSPCIAGEESIVCPAKGTAYKDGNFLKCAPLKKVAGGKDDGGKEDKLPEPIIITQTVERIVTVEVPSAVSIAPPLIVTEESCKTYKDDIEEKILTQGDAFLSAADTSFKATAVKNPEFKKVFYQILTESAKKRRALKKLVNTSACNGEALDKIDSTAKDFETLNLEKLKQTISFLDKNTTVQNQYVGIQEDFRWIENFAKSLRPNSQEQKTFAEDFKTVEEIKADYLDILNAGKGGKVFSFEIDGIAERLSETRKNIQVKVSSNESLKSESKSLEKKAKSGTKKLKKAAKSSSKKAKKTSKSKKSAKKINKK